MQDLQMNSGRNNQDLINNTKDHIVIVEGIINDTSQIRLQYSNDIEVVRDELLLTRTAVQNQIDDIKNSITPHLENIYRDLLNSVTVQKNENNKLQKDITQLKKQSYNIDQVSQITNQRAAQLEDIVGSYR